MNQKLRTSSGIAVLLALLGIVCLSLGMFFTVAGFSYAADGDAEAPADTVLPAYDNQETPNALWLVSSNGTDFTPLKDGGTFKYLYFDDRGNTDVTQSKASDLNRYVFFNGDVETNYSVKLNPEYVYNGTALGEAYNLDTADYDGSNTGVGEKEISLDVSTTVKAHAKAEGADALNLTKTWTIATVSNGVTGGIVYNPDNPTPYEFGDNHSSTPLSEPEQGNIVVYDITGTTNSHFAVRYNGSQAAYFTDAAPNAEGVLEVVGNPIDVSGIPSGSNYFRQQMKNLRAGDYVMTVTTSAVIAEGVYYAPSIDTFRFKITPVSISSGNALADGFAYTLPEHLDRVYSGGSDNAPAITLTYNGITLERNADYTLTTDMLDVCDNANIVISGMGTVFNDTFTIENAFSIIPATNSWTAIPNIMRWQYGSYSKQVNLLTAVSQFGGSDLYFSVYAEGVNTPYAGLERIVLDSDGYVNDAQESILNTLPAGTYRLAASVDGNNNYGDLSDEIVFQVFKGVNSWDAGEIPSIKPWFKGKYDAEENAINAKAKFGTAQVVIRNAVTKEVVYATDINGTVITDELASAGVGTYEFTATVAGTNDYARLSTTFNFEIARKGLPAWAVVLIVAGSLGVVALVFFILHEKGVLQMLTGKVIIAMRTRANVDATIAAVRANRVAREAEASIAAAKAREAEEAKKQQK